MLFPTASFGLFFLGVFALGWSTRRSLEWHKIVLLVASWIFYGAWDWRFVALLIASGFLNWGAARLILHFDAEERARRLVLIAGVVANLCILGWFKYYGFFMEQFVELLHGLGWQRDVTIMQVVLPVGISFFTFQGMSYLIDIYRRETQPARLLDMVLLMSFFPHLVAGPIVRASHLVPQLEAGPKLDRGMATMGFLLIVWGLFKKSIIASYLATEFVDPIFFDPAAHGSLDLILASYGYAVQIYCDFSAYSDMAIGLAALLGYRFPINFNQPYRAASLQDFWRRWHISLSSWLRDYLYIALGGSRHGPARLYLALMTTMLLGGLWHGASWNFVIWGAIHGGVLVLERLWRQHRSEGWPLLPTALGIFITFHIVTLAWIFFRSASFDAASAYLAGIAALDFSRGTTVAPLGLVLILFGLALHAFPSTLIQRVALVMRRWSPLMLGLAIGATILVVDSMRPEGVEPFIYYQF